jgi:hypothetical protein
MELLLSDISTVQSLSICCKMRCTCVVQQQFLPKLARTIVAPPRQAQLPPRSAHRRAAGPCLVRALSVVSCCLSAALSSFRPPRSDGAIAAVLRTGGGGCETRSEECDARRSEPRGLGVVDDGSDAWTVELEMSWRLLARAPIAPRPIDRLRANDRLLDASESSGDAGSGIECHGGEWHQRTIACCIW